MRGSNKAGYATRANSDPAFETAYKRYGDESGLDRAYQA
jgi:hypothetical protein